MINDESRPYQAILASHQTDYKTSSTGLANGERSSWRGLESHQARSPCAAVIRPAQTIARVGPIVQ